MKRTGIIFLMLIALALAGCATMSDIQSSVSTKVSSITSNVDPKLVAQVPEDKRGEFPKAEFAVKVAEEKAKLAGMKSELAAKQKKYADYEEDLADLDVKDAGLDFDIVKMGAIDTAGLGKKEDNIKALTKLKLKKNDLQGDRVKAEGNLSTLKQQMNDLNDKIKAQEEQIKNLTAEKAKPEKAADAAAGKGNVTEEKPKEKAPEATPAPTAPAPPAAQTPAAPAPPAAK
jgi:chromosome segregation ATPase